MTVPLGIVVDDDAQVRLFLATVLRRGGLNILEATSGSHALTLALTANPAFIVTDLEMPDVDGLELCRRLRQSPATSKLPIVMVTGAAATQEDDATAAGCDVVLQKPCPPAVLLATIQQLLRKQSGSTGAK